MQQTKHTSMSTWAEFEPKLERLIRLTKSSAMFGVLSGWQIPAEVRAALSRKIAKQVTNGAR